MRHPALGLRSDKKATVVIREMPVMRVPDHMPCSTRTRPANRPTTAFALVWLPAHRLGRYDGGLAELLAAALAVAALAWFAGPQ
jgi:hypothetical protein